MLRSKKLLLENVRMRNRTVDQLPPPLSANFSLDKCGKSVLDFSYEAIVNHLPVVGQYEFVPAVGGWGLRVDKPGTPGGFIIDNSSVVDRARLVFTLNITNLEFVRNNKELLVILQSYDNGGMC